MSKENSTNKYCMLILLQCLCNAFGPPMTKLIYESVSTNWYMAIRFSTAAVFLFLFWGKRIRKGWQGKSVFKYTPLFLCTLLGYYLTNIAIQYTSSTNVGFIISLPVVIAPLMERFLFRRRYSPKHIPVLCVVVLGLFLLAFDGAGVRLAAGDLLAVLAAVALAGTLVFGERASREVDAVALLAPSMLLTAAVSVFLAVGFDGIQVFGHITIGSWAGLLYLALVGSLFVTYLSNVALKRIPSTLVSELQAVQPVMTAIISFFLLGERIGGAATAGAVLVILAVVMDNRITMRSETAARQSG